jgi:trimethylguanosine synthase
MKHFICDAHQVWEVSRVDHQHKQNVFTELHPFQARKHDEASGKIQHYWERRFEYWPNFANGICTDIEGLFSVTPWDAACSMAVECDQFFGASSPLIVDPCCGVGGNLSAFARCIAGSQVIGVDINMTRVKCARLNAVVLGVAKSVHVVRSDGITFLRSIRQQVRFVFASPPWGGPGYSVKVVEDIPFDMFGLVRATCQACIDRVGRLALFLPRSFPIDQAKRLAIGKGVRLFRFDAFSGSRWIGSCFLYDGLRISE